MTGPLFPRQRVHGFYMSNSGFPGIQPNTPDRTMIQSGVISDWQINQQCVGLLLALVAVHSLLSMTPTWTSQKGIDLDRMD